MVVEINNSTLAEIAGQERTYQAINVAAENTYQKNDQHQIDAMCEILAKVEVNEIPLNKLKLKINTPAIIRRNINLFHGLTNGTRVIITEMHDISIVVRKILTDGTIGDTDNSIVRMTFEYKPQFDNSRHLLPFKRIQYPLSLAFASTMNRAKLQTLSKVGCFHMGKCTLL